MHNMSYSSGNIINFIYIALMITVLVSAAITFFRLYNSGSQGVAATLLGTSAKVGVPFNTKFNLALGILSIIALVMMVFMSVARMAMVDAVRNKMFGSSKTDCVELKPIDGERTVIIQ
jgi:hypothetical protein